MAGGQLAGGTNREGHKQALLLGRQGGNFSLDFPSTLISSILIEIKRPEFTVSDEDSFSCLEEFQLINGNEMKKVGNHQIATSNKGSRQESPVSLDTVNERLMGLHGTSD